MELKETVTYFGQTGEIVKVGWNHVATATKYIYRVKSVERNTYIKINGEQENETTETYFSFAIPFSGHFIPELKAVDAAGNSSTWSTSDKKINSSVNGIPAAWWIYGHIAPPAGNLQIETQEKEP